MYEYKTISHETNGMDQNGTMPKRTNAPKPDYTHAGAMPNARAMPPFRSKNIPRSDVIAYPCRDTRQSLSMTEQYPCRGIPISELIDKNDHATEKCYLKLLLLITLLLLKTN